MAKYPFSFIKNGTLEKAQKEARDLESIFNNSRTIEYRTQIEIKYDERADILENAEYLKEQNDMGIYSPRPMPSYRKSQNKRKHDGWS